MNIIKNQSNMDIVSKISEEFQVHVLSEGIMSDKIMEAMSNSLLSNFFLLSISKGTLKITAGDQTYKCTANTMFILSPFTSYHISASKSPECVCRFICFDLSPYLQRKSLEKFLLNGNCYLCDKYFSKLNTAWEELYSIDVKKRFGHTALQQLYIKAIILCMIRCIINNSENSRLLLYNKHSFQIVNEAIEYTEKHISERIDIMAISKHVGSSKSSVYHAFKDTVSVSAIKFLTRYKMKKATEMLRRDMMVKEIAMALGYSSSCHFSKAFKANFGCSPSEWKRCP